MSRSSNKACPICGAAVTPPTPKRQSATAPTPPQGSLHFPFCSDRCKMVDLNRWLTGAYAIPGDPVPPTDEE